MYNSSFYSARYFMLFMAIGFSLSAMSQLKPRIKGSSKTSTTKSTEVNGSTSQDSQWPPTTPSNSEKDTKRNTSTEPQWPPTDKTNEIKFTPPRVVTDEEITPSATSTPEIKVNERTDNPVLNQIHPDTEQVQTISNAPDDEPTLFVKVEEPATYPGGESAWLKHLQKNMDGSVPGNEGAPPGTYMIIISFMVNEQGYISNVNALTNYGFGMENEAIRVLKKSGNWIPAMQNGAKVKSFVKQTITFVVQE